MLFFSVSFLMAKNAVAQFSCSELNLKIVLLMAGRGSCSIISGGEIGHKIDFSQFFDW